MKRPILVGPLTTTCDSSSVPSPISTLLSTKQKGPILTLAPMIAPSSTTEVG
ncbi:Uncharacterised protein [Vibrio cholerae]|nr:Uncharacterised protein [Vibrio cholerae]